MPDSKIWEAAYEGYKKKKGRNALSKAAWKSQITGKPAKKPKKIKIRQKQTWLEIHKDFLRWKKTPEFEKWRRKQFLKQGGTCYYCDEPLSGARQNIEHIIPKSKGGDNRRSNLVIACSRCNKEKNVTLLPVRVKNELKAKNKKKRGTYLQSKELYMSEEDLAYKLKEMFMDE